MLKRTTLLLVLSLAVTFALSSACSQNPKVVLLKTAQTSTSLLRTAQAAENALCQVDPAKATHCLAVLPNVTPADLDAAHVKISGVFVKAFTDNGTFIDLASQWQPGQPVPTSLVSVKADVDQVFALLNQLNVPDRARDALAKTQAVIDLIADTLKNFGVK